MSLFPVELADKLELVLADLDGYPLVALDVLHGDLPEDVSSRRRFGGGHEIGTAGCVFQQEASKKERCSYRVSEAPRHTRRENTSCRLVCVVYTHRERERDLAGGE